MPAYAYEALAADGQSRKGVIEAVDGAIRRLAVRPESRRAFRSLLHLGYTEAFRALHPDERGAYSFWDYQRGAFQLDHGIRIDHLLLSPQAADRLVGCTIDKEPRRQPKASDHTPVVVELQD